MVATAMSHSGSTNRTLDDGHPRGKTMELTDQCLLTQVLRFCVVLAPLEERESLVDEWQDIHACRPLQLFHINGRLELSDRIVELLLVQQ